jgi:hypothetical protein
MDIKDKSRILSLIDNRPYICNGLTLSDNSTIVEFKYPQGVELKIPPDGTEIYEFTRSGHKILIGVYDSFKGKWNISY